VQSLGIAAEFVGRNDLTVGGRKFSGNAFCFQGQNALHHGTILVAVDMEKLTRYLQVSQEKIRAKGITSVQARVVNLREYFSSLTIEKMANCIIQAFKETYGASDKECSDPQDPCREEQRNPEIKALYEKHASWQWQYGQSPQFDISLETRFTWGGMEIGLQLENGKIKKVFVYSDALDQEFMELLPQSLNGCNFRSLDMAECIRKIGLEAARIEIAEDIARWLEEKKL
jgi:lipoate-protein ligase A